MARPRLISDEQILHATRACVLKRGPQVSTDAIAKELGVTGPALLKRFGNREELLLQALRPDPSAGFFKRFDSGPDERPIEEQLKEHLSALWDFFLEVIPCITALRESGIPHERIFDMKGAGPLIAMQAIERWLARAKARGHIAVESPDAVATALLGAVQHRAFTSYMFKEQLSARGHRAFLNDLTAFFGRALRPASSTTSRK